MRPFALLFFTALGSLTVTAACEFPSTGGPEPVPSIAYCDSVSAWPSADVGFEEDVFALVNKRRSEGATCGGESFSATGPLEYDGSLICAARKHSQDMVNRGYFSHDNPDGEGPGERADKAEFGSRSIGENIAAGQRTPEAVMDAWMNSEGHCRNIMRPGYQYIGIGHIDSHWTQVFGSK